MKMTLTAIALAAAAWTMAAHAAERYPNRPVRFIVPYPPGGGSDITGRAIGERLSASTGQTFVIDNRPGATGLIGTEIAARSPGDGYTIILADAPHTINAVVRFGARTVETHIPGHGKDDGRAHCPARRRLALPAPFLPARDGRPDLEQPV